nr:putative integron gene cassette protein [uncultured bacterium]
MDTSAAKAHQSCRFGLPHIWHTHCITTPTTYCAVNRSTRSRQSRDLAQSIACWVRTSKIDLPRLLAVRPNNSLKPRPLRGLARVSLAGCGPA